VTTLVDQLVGIRHSIQLGIYNYSMSAIRLRRRVPANEADFEVMGLAVLRAHWNCPSLDLYAHRGEKQFGIDIIDLSGAEPVSAGQCKLHEEWKTIPPAEIKAEVKKAREFRPKLGRYAILTTAKASRAAQDAVIKINREHHKQGLFSVELITWGKIERILDQHEEVGDEFDQTIGGRRVREISEKLSEIHEVVVPKPASRDLRSAELNEPAPIPKADPHRFAVAIAHLTHDNNQEVERLILESIRDLAGVQILRFDRTISAEGPIPEESVRSALKAARTLLHESSADVMIWGTVLSHDGRTAPRLYWTTAEASVRSKQPYIPENFQLPELFWDDLVEILRLLVVTRSSELFTRRGRFNAAELSPFVDKVRSLLESGHASHRWASEATTRVMFILAMALQQLGLELSVGKHLSESIRYYRNVLTRWPLDKFPGDYLSAKNGLGVALGALGSLESDVAHLHEAVRNFRDVIARTAGDDSLQMVWASAQNNLGNALLKLGEIESGVENLEKSAQAYLSASNCWSRESFPLDWAALQNNLGYVLQIEGSRSSRTDLLSRVIAAHRSGLEEWRRKEVPMYWAQAQNNLGNALKALGELSPGIELLEEAADAYRLALEERAFGQTPLAWGEAQSNLGTVLTGIADRNGDQNGLAKAVNSLRESLKVRTREAAPMAFASSQNNLGYALIRLGEFKHDARHFEEAISSLREALQVWRREVIPSRWSIAQHNLGDALTSLGRAEKNLDYLDQAIEAYAEALTERDRNREPLLWASTQAALGQVHFLKGEWGTGTESLEVAVTHYNRALEQYPNGGAPFARAGVEFNLGAALRVLGLRKSNSSLISEALEHHAAACRTCLQYSPYWALRAAEAADEDMNILKGMSDASTHGAILLKHGWISTFRLKHVGHEIGLMPVYRVAVPGTSGSTKPDFSLAPRRGDRIKDGSVVWENAGKYSCCRQCSEFLAPPNPRSTA
jgi:tetratricopeptide (TPR) repeat protein